MGEKSKVCFVFPGQGSQYVGMGRELFEQFAIAKQVFMEAEEVLGSRLSRLCFAGPDAELKLTENTQPAILTVSVAAFRVLESESSLRAFCVAGHSLGEFSALVAVGALSFRDALRIVQQRGRLMQKAVAQGEGSMAAILGLEAQEVQLVCEQASNGDVVSPANYNGARQTVISGRREAVLRAMALARERGARRVLELPVSAPFHCLLMVPASVGLERVLADVAVQPFFTGVITNVEAVVNLDPGRVKPLLVEQVVRPVRWEESVQHVGALGCRRVLELGPGKVLSGLVKRIDPSLEVTKFENPEDIQDIVADSGLQ
ncbi:MAG: ACP S-malonyltransferase [Deltaproteobacteria bacterium]|nr:ACP S-malonyltransferase [Deltaproteobacteria bacterium]